MDTDPLIQAIERLDTTWKRRAARIKITERQLLTWRKKGVPPVVSNLEEAGVIHVTGSCPCTRPDQSEPADIVTS